MSATKNATNRLNIVVSPVTMREVPAGHSMAVARPLSRSPWWMH